MCFHCEAERTQQPSVSLLGSDISDSSALWGSPRTALSYDLFTLGRLGRWKAVFVCLLLVSLSPGQALPLASSWLTVVFPMELALRWAAHSLWKGFSSQWQERPASLWKDQAKTWVWGGLGRAWFLMVLVQFPSAPKWTQRCTVMGRVDTWAQRSLAVTGPPPLSLVYLIWGRRTPVSHQRGSIVMGFRHTFKPQPCWF